MKDEPSGHATVHDPERYRLVHRPATPRWDKTYGPASHPDVQVLGVDYTATRRTLSPQSFVMSSMSEVSMTTGRRCRSAISATAASMAYL